MNMNGMITSHHTNTHNHHANPVPSSFSKKFQFNTLLLIKLTTTSNFQQTLPQTFPLHHSVSNKNRLGVCHKLSLKLLKSTPLITLFIVSSDHELISLTPNLHGNHWYLFQCMRASFPRKPSL